MSCSVGVADPLSRSVGFLNLPAMVGLVVFRASYCQGRMVVVTNQFTVFEEKNARGLTEKIDTMCDEDGGAFAFMSPFENRFVNEAFAFRFDGGGRFVK